MKHSITALRAILIRSCQLLFFGCLLRGGFDAVGAEVAGSKRVLFLGNSVFCSRGGLCPTFEGFCREAALEYEAVSQWKKPANLMGIEFLNHGRIPLNLPAVVGGEKIHGLIRNGGFDYVISEARREGYLLPPEAGLAQDRGESIPYRENAAALKSLHRTIAGSGAQAVLYMHPGGRADVFTKHIVGQIYCRLHADLEAMEVGGVRHSVLLVPAMELWVDAIGKSGVDSWYVDAQHGSPLAHYASACMRFTYITGRNGRRLQYRTLVELKRDWDSIPEKAGLEAKAKTRIGSSVRSDSTTPLEGCSEGTGTKSKYFNEVSRSVSGGRRASTRFVCG